MNTIINSFLQVEINNKRARIFEMKIGDLLPIYYVAVRGRDNIEGAVQRVLNRRRINSIKDFILDGNSFYNLFILNWVESNSSVIEDGNGKLLIPQVANSVQVIDGQHRLEGFKEACKTKPIIAEQSVIILLFENLNTNDAARIFLNINTEQRPVPSSLVYDLFGEIKPKDFYMVRAKEIATRLNSDPESPYYQCVKMPGTKIGKVDLSTFVSVLKQYTIDGGVFDQYRLSDFESQYKIVFNYLEALKFFYDIEGKWMKNINPFMSNAGCYSGIDFLFKELISKCADRKDFSVEAMKSLLKLNETGLLEKTDIKDQQGKEQRAIIFNYLKKALLKDLPATDEYKF